MHTNIARTEFVDVKPVATPRTSVEKVHDLLPHLANARTDDPEMNAAIQAGRMFLPLAMSKVPSDPAVLDAYLNQTIGFLAGLVSDGEPTHDASAHAAEHADAFIDAATEQ